MRQDKITIFYVLMTLTILIAASIFIYNIDLSKNNAQISEKAERVYGSGKEYSKKVYSMLSAYTDDMGNYFSEDDVNVDKHKISKQNLNNKKKVKINRTKTKLKVTTKPIAAKTLDSMKEDVNITNYKSSSLIIKTTKDK